MKKWNSQKLLLASAIFLFTTMMAAPIALEATTISETAKITQEAVVQAVVKAPAVAVSAPKAIHIAKLREANIPVQKITLRDISYGHRVINALLRLPLQYNPAKTIAASAEYGDEEAGYVNLGSRGVMSGTIGVDATESTLASNLAPVAEDPEEFGVNPLRVNVQDSPKVIEMRGSDGKESHLLAMDPWDFRLARVAKYDRAALKDLLMKAYATFKGYSDLSQKKAPSEDVEVHTGFWGVGVERNNARVTTVIQIMASQLAGVDQLVFHLDSTKADTNALTDAEIFLAAHQGKSVSDILRALQEQTSNINWRPGR